MPRGQETEPRPVGGKKTLPLGGLGLSRAAETRAEEPQDQKKSFFQPRCRLQTRPAPGLLLQGLDLAEPVPTSGAFPGCSASCPPRGGAGGSQNNPDKAWDLFIVLKKAPGCFQKLSERPHLMRKSRLRLVSLPMLKTWLGGSQVLLWGS